MKRGLLFLSLGLLFGQLFTVLFTSSSASATSIYDTNYIQTSTLQLTNQNIANCPLDPLDITINWSQYITDESKWLAPLAGSSYLTQLQAMKTSFSQALETGRWGVSQAGGIVTVFWTEDTSLELDWTLSPPYIFAHSTELRFANIGTSCTMSGGNGSNAAYGVEVYYSTEDYNAISGGALSNLFVYTDYPNYPTDYEGTQIPSNLTIKQNKFPSVSIEKFDKTIFVRPNENVELPDERKFRLKYELNNVPEIEEEVTYLEEQTGNSSDPVQFNVPENDTYNLWVSWLDENNQPLTSDDEFDYLMGKYMIEVDGTTSTVNTDDLECNENTNICTEPSNEWVAEPCSITELGGCIQNAIHHIKVFLGINKTPQNPSGSPFLSMNNQTDTFGVTSIVYAPFAVLQNLSQAHYTCTPVSLPLPFVGGNLQMPCLYAFYQNNFGQAFTMYQTVIFGLVAYYVGVQLFATVKGAKDPKNDRVEVHKL